MFGFGRRPGITDQEMWGLAIRVAVKMTAEEDVSPQVVGMQQSTEIFDAECKHLRLRPTTEQQKYIEAAVHALSSTALTRSLMDRWLRDGRVTITQDDIDSATKLLELLVQKYMAQRTPEN